jgi:hypothetical protein
LLGVIRPTDERKLRLLGCAGCRLTLSFVQATREGDPSPTRRNPLPIRQYAPTATEDLVRAIALAERFADGEGDLPVEDWYHREDEEFTELVSLDRQILTHDAQRAARSGNVTGDLVLEIFGDPSASVSFDPDWRTSTAVGIAKGMYESRDFSAMPILADALQDAGCDNADVLNHCRDANQSHYRGCWVLDLLLNKVAAPGA